VSADAVLALGRADPGDADAVFRAGAIAVRNGFAAEALPLLEAGSARHAGDARIWQVLGLAYRQLDDLAAAMSAMGKAAALAPREALIAHTLARATLEAGQPAVDEFQHARALAPGDGSVLLGLAAALLAAERIDEAIALLDAQVAAQPAWLEGQATLARLRWMRGERDGFAVGYERALLSAPRDRTLWRALINLLMQADLHDRALAAIAEAKAAAGRDPLFDALEAICTSESGAVEAAEPMFARLLPLGHLSSALRYVRHLLRGSRPGEAATVAEAWLGDPEGDSLWPYLAAAWRLTGDPRWQWLEGDPRFVGSYDIGDQLSSLEGMAERCRALHQRLDQPLEQSVRGGTQTDGPLFSRIEPELVELRRVIAESVAAHIAQLPAHDPKHPLLRHRRDRPVRFSGSWSVRLTDGGRHANHVHPAGWLSSAFYLTLPAPQEGDETHAGWLTLGEPQDELGLGLAPFREIEPKPGRLVLFPSTMWHGTRPFRSGERMTVAFDVARPTT
jgi:tetratricopeptide (TPR) repeat protein